MNRISHKSITRPRRNESGNVLWFILIAVVLLGLLTMLLSRSGSSVDQTASFEQQRIKATQLMRYASGIQAAIEKLQSINGCSENEISFENTVETNYENTRAPDDNSCHVFAPEGAGLEWRALTDQTSVAFGGEGLGFTGNIILMGQGTDSSHPGADLLVLIPVTQSLCMHINSQFGISSTAADITSDLDSTIKFTGPFSDGFSFGNGAGEAPAVAGEPIGCIIDDNGEYLFYHVLLAR